MCSSDLAWGSGSPALLSYREGTSPPHPSGLPARAGPSCLLPSGDGLTPWQGWGPPRGRTGSPRARMAGEQSEPREGPSLVQDHTAPCQGPCWASGARSHRLETVKGRPGLDPCHPAPAHLPRSHPGQQPSCSTAQRSGHGARGVPMPRAPVRPHAAHSLHCRRRGEEAVPGCRRAPPPAHPLFRVGETHSAQPLRDGERSGDTGRRRRWVCPPTPSPWRLSALSGWLPLPEAGSLLGWGRVFCLPPPASPALSGPRSQCPGAQPPAGATLLGAVGAGAGPAMPDLPRWRWQPPQWQWAARLWGLSSRPAFDLCLPSYPGRWAPPHPLGGPVGLSWMGGSWGRLSGGPRWGTASLPPLSTDRSFPSPQCWGWSWGFQEPGLAAQPRCLLSH